MCHMKLKTRIYGSMFELKLNITIIMFNIKMKGFTFCFLLITHTDVGLGDMKEM